MTWATSTTGLGSEPSSTAAALLPNAGSGASFASVPGALWRDGEAWDGSSIVVVEPQGMRAVGTAAAARGYLWVPVTAPRAAQRGRLALHIEECIESALEQRGAPPPGIGASTHLDASLSDQLYRARFVEMRGIAVGIPSLEGIANLGRVLDAEDSAVLRWWLAATTDRPLCVVLSSENRALRVYPSPVPFTTVMEGIAPPTPRAPSVETAQSVVAMELSDLPPSVAEVDAEEPASLADGVELPDLDRALGLSPLLGAVETSHCLADEPEDTSLEAAPASSPVVVEPEAPVEASAESAAGEPAPSGELDEHHVPVAPNAAALAPLPVKTLVSPRLLARKSEALAKVPAEVPAVESREEASTAPAVPALELEEGGDEPAIGAAAPSASTPAPGALALAPRKRSPFVLLPAEESEEGVVAEAPRDEQAAVVSLAPVPAERMPLARSALKPLRPRVVAPTTRPVDSPAPLAVAAVSESVEPAAANPPPARPALEAASAEGGTSTEPDPFDAFARDNWRSWVRELDAARGPKPLAVIERLFVTAYMRLDAALERKIADQSAREVMDAWRDSFEKSYTEAFDALRVRGKRPTMVLDVPDLAQRMGRLHGARRVQLLLVDGLRFDLGMMIQDRLKSGGEATLTERLLLWSALPANTATQVELIGRGPDGLKDKDMPVETPAVVARGRAAHALRRIRTGRRELFKLDIVEASLREGEGNVRERLHTIADDVAASITDHFSKQPPRTLVMVFGDHGFRVEDETKVSQGGATPEEVLVPAFAWLTGAMH